MTSLNPIPFDPQMIGPLSAQGMYPVSPPPVTREELPSRREMLAPLSADAFVFKDPEIEHREEHIPRPDGSTIEITIAQKKDGKAGLRPGIFYMHGGGLILGTRKFLLEESFPWVKELDAVLITTEYRLAPEYQHPAALDDCYASLEWMSKNTAKLGVDPRKVMVAGHSAGGGLAAGIALLARDRKLEMKFCAQLLVYPMLDDRMQTVSSQQMMNDGTWTGKSNAQAWEWYLGPAAERAKKEGIIYAAPGRATDLSALPPTLIEVGTAETFRDEVIKYATRLLECGTSTELHVYSGAFHGSDMWAKESDVAQACLATRRNWLNRIFRSASSTAMADASL
ncbi:Alpha/Beta hydrolase protein [Amylocarpus encephaloides]|uniref:Alpha/Beta hydrolase protein n=1 Tax=Amylocarpus encephaloides TaxID=45428 RepID=A0A9P7YLB3_9HELO|nr:Alpha/Beta hydrolase protein [Amylocarpus encephaloides]